MHIKVKSPEKKDIVEVELSSEATVGDVLCCMELKPDSHIVLLDGTPVPEDYPLEEGQQLTILKVASGG